MAVRVQLIHNTPAYIYPGKGSVGKYMYPGDIHEFEESYDVAKGLFRLQNSGYIQIIDKDFVLRTVMPDLGAIAFTLTYNFTLTSLDISNKYITVPEPIVDQDSLNVDISGAPDVNLNVDYGVVGGNRITWEGFPLDGILTVGDRLRVKYRDPNS